MTVASRADVASSFTVKYGALIDETYAVFVAWDFTATKRANLDRLRESNFMGAKSAAWPRDVAKVLNRRFDPDGRDRPLALLAKQGEDPPALLAEVRTRQRRHQEELRAFLDEVTRVAPLRGPDLDDGVVINFAPLRRLVPQHKAWQKELRATWEALCGAEYDGSHLAMRLWPERVVPKRAKDRSLAIARGLEDVFWVEGADGKWTARKKPTKDVDALVQERTSAAVKSALQRLLDAPAAQGVGRRPRKGKA